MSEQINAQALKQFIIDKVGYQPTVKKVANELKLTEKEVQEVNEDENLYVELDEILDNEDLTGKFTALYTAEQEKQNTAKSKEEKEKEVDQKRLSGKSDARRNSR